MSFCTDPIRLDSVLHRSKPFATIRIAFGTIRIRLQSFRSVLGRSHCELPSRFSKGACFQMPSRHVGMTLRSDLDHSNISDHGVITGFSLRAWPRTSYVKVNINTRQLPRHAPVHCVFFIHPPSFLSPSSLSLRVGVAMECITGKYGEEQ
jgi:hypothetical protein